MVAGLAMIKDLLEEIVGKFKMSSMSTRAADLVFISDCRAVL
jgi:hypothetical protein